MCLGLFAGSGAGEQGRGHPHWRFCRRTHPYLHRAAGEIAGCGASGRAFPSSRGDKPLAVRILWEVAAGGHFVLRVLQGPCVAGADKDRRAEFHADPDSGRLHRQLQSRSPADQLGHLGQEIFGTCLGGILSPDRRQGGIADRYAFGGLPDEAVARTARRHCPYRQLLWHGKLFHPGTGGLSV